MVCRIEWALRYAPDPLKDDKDVVIAAVTQSGLVLQCISDTLKDDREVVLAAVTLIAGHKKRGAMMADC